MFAVIGVPLIIELCFVFDKGIPTVWDGAELLGYYGSILGAVATIVAVYKTIDFTIKNQREEKKLSIRPYLQTSKIKFDEIDYETCLSELSEIKLLTISKDKVSIESPKYTIFQHKDNYIDIFKILKIKSKEFSIFDIIDCEEEQILEMFENNFSCFLYEIDNVGANNAMCVTFNAISSTKMVGKTNTFCVTTNKPVKFLIIVNKDYLKDDEYIFVGLTYKDISSLGMYEQHETLCLTHYAEYKCIELYSGDSLSLTEPEEITKPKENQNGQA